MAETIPQNKTGLTPDDVVNRFLKNVDIVADTPTMETYIIEAEDSTERDTALKLKKTVIKTYPSSTLKLGKDYDEAGDPQDFYLEQTTEWLQTRTLHRPIITVESFRFVIGGGSEPPTMIEFPADWIRIDRRGGTIEIYPSPRSMVSSIYVYLMSGGGSGVGGGLVMPFLQQFDRVPGMIAVDYTVGFDPLPQTIKHFVARRAAINVLLNTPYREGGYTSESIGQEGMSQSRSFSASRLDELQKLDEKELKAIRKFYRGVDMIVI